MLCFVRQWISLRQSPTLIFTFFLVKVDVDIGTFYVPLVSGSVARCLPLRSTGNCIFPRAVHAWLLDIISTCPPEEYEKCVFTGRWLQVICSACSVQQPIHLIRKPWRPLMIFPFSTCPVHLGSCLRRSHLETRHYFLHNPNHNHHDHKAFHTDMSIFCLNRGAKP